MPKLWNIIFVNFTKIAICSSFEVQKLIINRIKFGRNFKRYCWLKFKNITYTTILYERLEYYFTS